MPLNIVGVCVHGLGGNFFSTGMDTLATELNRVTPVGCHFTVRGGNDPRLEEATITSDLLSALAKGATVIYIGHSLGADFALRFAQAAHNFKLLLSVRSILSVGIATHSRSYPGGGRSAATSNA